MVGCTIFTCVLLREVFLQKMPIWPASPLSACIFSYITFNNSSLLPLYRQIACYCSLPLSIHMHTYSICIGQLNKEVNILLLLCDSVTAECLPWQDAIINPFQLIKTLLQCYRTKHQIPFLRISFQLLSKISLFQ